MKTRILNNLYDLCKYCFCINFEKTDMVLFPCLVIYDEIYDKSFQKTRRLMIYIDYNYNIYYYTSGATKAKQVAKYIDIKRIVDYDITTMRKIEKELQNYLMI